VSVRRSTATVRLGAACGVVGPTAFITGWVVAGATTPGYSARQAISELARLGAPHRVLMTLAFLVFGVAMLAFARALPPALGGSAVLSGALTLSGLAVLGVAAFPLDPRHAGIENTLHGSFAVAGYVGTALAPLAGGWRWHRSGHPTIAVVSAAVGLASAVALAATSWSSGPGRWQRAGLTLADGWFIAMALWVLLVQAPRSQCTTSAISPLSTS